MCGSFSLSSSLLGGPLAPTATITRRTTPQDIAGGLSEDCNGDSVPDECEAAPVILGLGDSRVSVVGVPHVTAAADMNNDGALDLVVGSHDGVAASVTVFLGRGDRAFYSGVVTAVEGSISSLAVEDLDGDGQPDVATANGQFFLVLSGRPDGTLAEPVRYDNAADSPLIALARATVNLTGQPRVVTDYFQLVYSALKHNEHEVYWVVLDPPIQLDAFVRPVHVVEVRAPFDTTRAAASYLDEDFAVLTNVAVPVYDRQDAEDIVFRRGDCNGDSLINISDAIYHARMLFGGIAAAGCREDCESNGDGEASIADSIYLVEYIFQGGQPPPASFVECEDHPAPGTSLGCERLVCNYQAPLRRGIVVVMGEGRNRQRAGLQSE